MPNKSQNPQEQVIASLMYELKKANRRARSAEDQRLSEKSVADKILGIKTSLNKLLDPPAWLINVKPPKHGPGVPTLVGSDWHWGEVIDPKQIDGLNAYNLRIAHDRARRLIERTIALCFEHMVNPTYPGIVLDLLGDMFSGNIHEELEINNEKEIMYVVNDLLGVLVWCLRTLADRFGRVHVVCVTGNHGRHTKKIRYKGRAYTSYDWLLYMVLSGIFDGSYGHKDDRITFQIPLGIDARYMIYHHRFNATHGDKLGAHGGDGIIGAFGPILRGDTKKRAKNSRIFRDYDTLIMGHVHTYFPTPRIVVNGSLKGYDELADNEQYGFEPPVQALFFTHPEYGVTCHWPVHVEKVRDISPAPWCAIPGKKE